MKPENKMGKNLVTAEPRHAHIDQERRIGEREREREREREGWGRKDKTYSAWQVSKLKISW